MAMPISNSVPSSSGHCPVGTTSTFRENAGYRTAVIAMAMKAFMRGGITTLLRKGAKSITPDTRAPITSTALNTLAKEKSIELACVVSDAGKNLNRELRKLAPHPRHQDEDPSGSAKQSWDGRNCRILQRG